MSSNSLRARNQIATKHSQRFGTPTVECPRRGDMLKNASADERTAKNQRKNCPPFWFYGESIQTSMHGNDGNNVEARDSIVVYNWGCEAQESLWYKVIVCDEATI